MVQRERPDCLACAVFDAEPACEQERHTSLGNVSAKGGLYCIISTFTDYTIYYINSLYGTDGRPIICKNTA